MAPRSDSRRRIRKKDLKRQIWETRVDAEEMRIQMKWLYEKIGVLSGIVVRDALFFDELPFTEEPTNDD